MSGPVDRDDVPAVPVPAGPAGPPGLEVTPGRSTTVGGVPVRRTLPQPRRRTVGAWCFVDHLGPLQVTDERGLEVGPHPHVGLQTVTWLLEGEQLHRDSLGSEQTIRPGQLNLMTAGAGVVHAEETLAYRGPVHGVQLWLAQPDGTRDGAPDFEHHADLPRVELASAVATVLVGGLEGEESKARHDTPLVGLDLQVRAGTTPLPLATAFEHAVVVLEGSVRLADAAGEAVLEPGQLAHAAPGRDELVISAPQDARVLLLGGEPFPAPVFMWWNFVARSREEVQAAYDAWRAGDGRFGAVDTGLHRVPAPAPPWAQR